MEAAIEHMDVQYEAVFSEPLFDLPRRDAEVLKNFYRSLQESEYLVPISDMRVVGGAVFSDARIQIAMFRDLAMVELMPDKMSIDFKQLKSLTDRRICESCILASERAIRRIYPELHISMTVLFCGAQIKIKSDVGIHQLLKNVVGYGNDIDLSEFGDVEQFPAANATVLNKQKGWNAVFHAYPIASDESHLIASCRLHYTEASGDQNLDDRLHEFENRTRTLQRLFTVLTAEIGIHSADLDWEVDKEGNRGH